MKQNIINGATAAIITIVYAMCMDETLYQLYVIQFLAFISITLYRDHMDK